MQLGKKNTNPKFTTFKYDRKAGTTVQDVQDYIFINKPVIARKEVKLTDYLDPEDLDHDGLLNYDIGNPCPNHPSDHYSIGYKVLIKMLDEGNAQKMSKFVEQMTAGVAEEYDAKRKMDNDNALKIC